MNDRKKDVEEVSFDVKWMKVILTMIGTIIAVIVIRELKTIFLPLVFAIFLSFVFAPLNDFLSKHKIPKFIVIILMMIIIFGLLTLVGLIIYTAINSFVIEFPKYQARMIDMVNKTYADFQGFILRMEVLFSRIPEWFDRSQILSPGSFSLPRMVTGTMGSFVDFVMKLFLTLIYLAFIVAGSDRLKIRLEKSLTGRGKTGEKTFKAINGIRKQMKEYFLKKTIISLGTSFISMLFVLILRVDFVIITGLLIFVLNFIPNIGSIVASFFPVLICLLQYGFGWRVIGVAFFMLVTQMTFGNIIEPNYMGKGLNLSPIVVLLSLIFWGWVWGLIGMVIAVPLTSALNIMLKEIDDRSVISAIISGS